MLDIIQIYESILYKTQIFNSELQRNIVRKKEKLLINQ